MAATILIEEERGTFTRNLHPHNGYYAGDFRVTHLPEASPNAYAPGSALTSTVR